MNYLQTAYVPPPTAPESHYQNQFNLRSSAHSGIPTFNTSSSTQSCLSLPSCDGNICGGNVSKYYTKPTASPTHKDGTEGYNKHSVHKSYFCGKTISTPPSHIASQVNSSDKPCSVSTAASIPGLDLVQTESVQSDLGNDCPHSDSPVIQSLNRIVSQLQALKSQKGTAKTIADIGTDFNRKQESFDTDTQTALDRTHEQVAALLEDESDSEDDTCNTHENQMMSNARDFTGFSSRKLLHYSKKNMKNSLPPFKLLHHALPSQIHTLDAKVNSYCVSRSKRLPNYVVSDIQSIDYEHGHGQESSPVKSSLTTLHTINDDGTVLPSSKYRKVGTECEVADTVTGE